MLLKFDVQTFTVNVENDVMQTFLVLTVAALV